MVTMIDNVNDETVCAVAHHEAAHVVVACDRELAIGKKGAIVYGHPPEPTPTGYPSITLKVLEDRILTPT